MARYNCILTPDGLWTVWDDVKRIPAKLGGVLQVGLLPHHAEMVRDIMERIENSKLAAKATPQRSEAGEG